MKAVRNSINVACEPERAIHIFLRQEDLNHWWGVEKSFIENKAGGCYTLCWMISEHGAKYVSTGVIETLEPTRLSITNMQYLNPDYPILGPMTLEVTAIKTDKGCTLTIEQGGYQSGPDWDWYYEAVRQAWPQVMGTIKTYLEGL